MALQTTVTHEAKRPKQPIGHFVRLVFPKVPQIASDALAQLEDGVTQLPVDLDTGQLGRIGTAIDYQMRIRLGCFDFETSIAFKGIESVTRVSEIHDFGQVAKSFLSKFPQLWAKALEDESEMSRLCLCLAYFDPIYRRGPFSFGIPYKSLRKFMNWPESEISEVLSLSRTAVDCLDIDHIGDPIGNPVFGNRILRGDGDLVVNGCLVELKVSSKPQPEIQNWLYQLLLYVLLDHKNKYGISSVGLLLPRQSRFLTWGVDELGISEMPLQLIRKGFVGAEKQHAVQCLGSC